MKRIIVLFVCLTVLTISAVCFGQDKAVSKDAASEIPPGPSMSATTNVRAYCTAHKNNPGPGEQSQDEIPADVRAVGASYWRCMDGKVMICNGGATGFACLRTERVDARRRQAFREFCAQNPGSDYIPNALTAGLSSSWRCKGKTPVALNAQPVDRFGYIKASWRLLN